MAAAIAIGPVPEAIVARALDHDAGLDVELDRELLSQLVLPLLDKAAGRDDQTAFEIAMRDHFLDR